MVWSMYAVYKLKCPMSNWCDCGEPRSVLAQKLNEVAEGGPKPPEFHNEYVKTNFFYRVGSLVNHLERSCNRTKKDAKDCVAQLITWGPPSLLVSTMAEQAMGLKRRYIHPDGFRDWCVSTVGVADSLLVRMYDYLWFGPDVAGIEFAAPCLPTMTRGNIRKK